MCGVVAYTMASLRAPAPAVHTCPSIITPAAPCTHRLAVEEGGSLTIGEVEADPSFFEHALVDHPKHRHP